MNIFVLDMDPKICAQYYNDRHTVKIILEAAQLLSNAHWHYGTGPFRKVFFNHPCSIWARESKANYKWLAQLADELCHEYTFRYNKDHAWHEQIHWLFNNIPDLPDIPMTEIRQAMPDYCKIVGNPVQAYRNYYCKEKTHIAVWKNRDIPEWYRKVS
jgi:hypothetical protein